MFQFHPSFRPNLDDIRAHPWLDKKKMKVASKNEVIKFYNKRIQAKKPEEGLQQAVNQQMKDLHNPVEMESSVCLGPDDDFGQNL